ncbi:MAG: ABC transporter ATP-binding protein [Candidatus Omnitrophica bacterium]|nr:ABC transporter ATP-binding protein [Candidatus Omnitrophota bacterium]
MAKSLFELKEIYFSYLGKIPALCGINLKIEEGSKVAVIGANGTGKPTLLTMLDALAFPDKGSIKAFDKELTEELFTDNEFSRFFRSKVGFVFQNPEVQLFCPTVKEDIAFGPLQLGVSPEETKKRLEEVVSELRIAHILGRSPHQLSIGEKRKVAIASVLAVKPDVLLLDEPTAGLDPQTTRDIIDILVDQNKAGKTILTATHDMHIIEEIADVVHVFSTDKKIVRSANPSELLSDQLFLETHNLVHIHRHHHKEVVHTHSHLHKDEHHH